MSALRFAWVKSWSGTKLHVMGEGLPRLRETRALCSDRVGLDDPDTAIVLSLKECQAYADTLYKKSIEDGYHWSYFTSPFCDRCCSYLYNLTPHLTEKLKNKGEGWSSKWFEVADCLYCKQTHRADGFHHGLCHICYNSWRYSDALKRGMLKCSVCGVEGAQLRGDFPRKRSGTKVVVPFDLYCQPCYRRLYKRTYRVQKNLEELKELSDTVAQARREIKWQSEQREASALS